MGLNDDPYSMVQVDTGTHLVDYVMALVMAVLVAFAALEEKY